MFRAKRFRIGRFRFAIQIFGLPNPSGSGGSRTRFIEHFVWYGLTPQHRCHQSRYFDRCLWCAETRESLRSQGGQAHLLWGAAAAAHGRRRRPSLWSGLRERDWGSTFWLKLWFAQAQSKTSQSFSESLRVCQRLSLALVIRHFLSKESSERESRCAHWNLSASSVPPNLVRTCPEEASQTPSRRETLSRKGTNGVSTNGVTANIICFTEGAFG